MDISTLSKRLRYAANNAQNIMLDASNKGIIEFVDGLKSAFIDYRDENGNEHYASKEYINSIHSKTSIRKGTVRHVVAPDVEYAEYVDSLRGRYLRNPDGPYPNINKIKEWIRIKGIESEYSDEKLAFLIARKIAKDGLENKFITSTYAINAKEKYKVKMKDAISRMIKNAIG